ncbi:MAG: YggS family pyridoxal phosphate-dependent enzyme [Planctomycetes bacterium]|nr:YggS family pyridoxal phosphate-dependent enzyme [Planctomycetota bacterium]
MYAEALRCQEWPKLVRRRQDRITRPMTLSAADKARLAANVATVQSRIAVAAARVGRNPADVLLLPVTKAVSPPVIQGLLDLGLLDHGENRAERLTELACTFPVSCRPRWHLIGHIQGRKIRDALPLATCVHSVHSAELMQRLEARAAELERVVPVLLQINVAAETSKQGLDPAHIRALLAAAQSCPHLQVQGFMSMAPLDAAAPTTRATFAALRHLRDAHVTAALPLKELSMGMSGDFELAIEEGATIVRIGSALYEGLQDA